MGRHGHRVRGTRDAPASQDDHRGEEDNTRRSTTERRVRISSARYLHEDEPETDGTEAS